MFTLSVGGTGCPLRIPFPTIAPAPVEIFRRMPPRNCYTTFTTFTTVTAVLGLALPYPALSLGCRCQAKLLPNRVVFARTFLRQFPTLSSAKRPDPDKVKNVNWKNLIDLP
jgi:hypothetical protein